MGIFWLILCGLLIIVELCTVSFFAFFPAVGAFIAYITALLDFSLNLQIIVFLATSTLLIVFMKPIIDKLVKVPTKKTNVDRIISKTGIVIEKIDKFNGTGMVKIDGEVWSALAEKEDEIIEKNSKIKVLEVKGVKVIVTKI